MRATKMNKNEIINKAMKSALMTAPSTSAENKPVKPVKKATETPKVENKVLYDANIQFKVQKSNLADHFEEFSAINQYDGGDDLKTAERRAIKQLEKLREKQRNLAPAVQRYWENLFNGKEVISEHDIIRSLLEDEFLEENPINNTKMLNKLFQALWDGYLCDADGPASKSHSYKLAKTFFNN